MGPCRPTLLALPMFGVGCSLGEREWPPWAHIGQRDLAESARPL